MTHKTEYSLCAAASHGLFEIAPQVFGCATLRATGWWKDNTKV